MIHPTTGPPAGSYADAFRHTSWNTVERQLLGGFAIADGSHDQHEDQAMGLLVERMQRGGHRRRWSGRVGSMPSRIRAPSPCWHRGAHPGCDAPPSRRGAWTLWDGHGARIMLRSIVRVKIWPTPTGRDSPVPASSSSACRSNSHAAKQRMWKWRVSMPGPAPPRANSVSNSSPSCLRASPHSVQSAPAPGPPHTRSGGRPGSIPA